MIYLKQFGIIIFFSWVGNILSHILHLPVPGSVWGMILVFLLLYKGVLKLDKIEKVADFLLSIMTVMFVPVGVGLINSFQIIKSEILSIGVIIVLTTVITFIVTGLTAQKIMKKGDEKSERINM